MTKNARPDVDVELNGLKDFQRRTVDYVHDRLWHGDDPARRFLVADEVGLGKTLVARGVIAKAIDHLWDTVDRIDVVYICSNSQIARQNLARLRVGTDQDMCHADRLTLLAKEVGDLKGRKLNFVSFTPGTSFNIGRGGGHAGERVLLYWMLWKAWGREVRTERWLRFFQGGAGIESFERRLKAFDRSEITAELAQSFAASLEGATGPGGGNLADELGACVLEFKGRRRAWKPPYALSRRRYLLIGALRKLLARAAVTALEPDLVILDEFQRFKDLMNGQDEGSDLAHEVFNYAEARLVLLSATPYKMYTLPDEPEGDEHYRDFVDTVRFLSGEARAEEVEAKLSTLRSSLYSGELERAREAKDAVQRELRRVMVRTERLASTPDRDGMIAERSWAGVGLAENDIHDYRRLAATSRVLKAHDPLEYWRSSPYVLEFMDGYKLKRDLEKHEASDPDLVAALGRGGVALRWVDLEAYAPLDPANAKMRGLVSDVLDQGAWRLAWLPPSLPYYVLGGAYADPALMGFTKRLIFSSWNVVPKAVSTVVSYEAERRQFASRGTPARSYSARHTALLSFQRTADRLTGMPVLGLLYPSVALARVGDPLAAARELGTTFPIDREQLETHVASGIQALLDALPTTVESGPADEAWYWAAPILLDRAERADSEKPSDFAYGFATPDSDTTETRFSEHLDAADDVDVSQLGRQPDDLVDTLARLAIGGPGVTALRALSRVAGGATALTDPGIRDWASYAAWSLRGLFNRPEVTALVRGQSTHDEAYWRDVLNHCVDGCLQSVLDEYVHVLNESLGVATKPVAEKLEAIVEEIDDSLSLRAAVNTVTEFNTTTNRLEMTPRRVRTHFAVRFGRGVTEDAVINREGQVRTAYNSPFWPFVLASTSVGQEGLDFHQYSHAVVHWNLPSNPVDLEQREGRVHRYKGHAVRKNIAAKYADRTEVTESDDPWATLFELAARNRPPGETEVFPYWVFPLEGGAHIERYVPTLPLSQETHKYTRLMRTVGAYRMVVGQPRQEDLLRYLGDRAGELTDLVIDLSP